MLRVCSLLTVLLTACATDELTPPPPGDRTDPDPPPIAEAPDTPGTASEPTAPATLACNREQLLCPEAAAASGTVRTGADSFGYAFRGGGGCHHEFVDISATGDMVLLGDDHAARVPLTRAFRFYDRDVDALAFASNGYLSTDPNDSGPDLTNDCPLPAKPSTPLFTDGGRLYPLHDDLVTTSGYHQWFDCCPRPSDHADGVGCHIFQWQDAYHFGNVDPETLQPRNRFTFQAVLYDVTWEVAFVYPPGNPENGRNSTTGLLSPSWDAAAAYACDEEALRPQGDTVCFFHPDAPDPC